MAATAVPEFRTIYTVRAPSEAGERRGDMEGTTHAGTGFLLGAAAALFLHASAPHGAPAIESAAGDILFGAVTAGFALLPDADHPDASFAHAAGWLSHGISHLVATLFGGHRQGMHSLAGIAAMSAATEACTTWWPNRWTLGILALVMTICIAAGLTATGFVKRSGGRRKRSRSPVHGAEALVFGGAIAGAMVYVPAWRADLWWLVALGMALHVFEDSLTGHGVAFFWPVSRKRFGGDGKQPAARRPVTSGPRDNRPPAEPPRPRTGPSKPACPACWMGNCEECTDRGCGCPQREHPARPKRQRKQETATGPQPAGPHGTTIEWEWAEPDPADDIPPF